MDISELRVGNYVELHEYAGQGIFVRTGKYREVVEIHTNTVSLSKIEIPNFQQGPILVPDSLVEPITLTEEMLIKLGFVSRIDEEEDCRWWSKEGFSLHEEYYRIDEEETVSGEFAYATYMRGERFKGGIAVKSVHHLQNLYFSTQLKEVV